MMDVAIERSSSCGWKGPEVNKLPWLASLTAAGAVGLYFAQRERTALRLQQAAAVFGNTSEAIIITDARQRIVAVNPAFTAITGYSAGEVLGKNPSLQHSGMQDQAFYRRMWADLNETGQWQGEIWNRRKSGEVYAAWENISAVRGHDGSVAQYVAVLADITPVKRAQQQLEHIAYHDVLTGLPNRLLFAAGLGQALERAKRHGHRVALLFIDLDRFKGVNDTLGHAAGDELLQEVARRLQRTVRAQDLLARLSGDEFVVLFEEIAGRGEAVHLAQKIGTAVSQPMVLAQRRVSVSASVGIALYPDDAATADALLCLADAAMYRAKGAARAGA